MKIIFLILTVLISGLLEAQDRTVGLFEYDSTSYNGYNLFSPAASRTTFLIDNCGELINMWEGTGFPGLSAYLLENGDLLRTSKTSSAFQGGGIGGIIEKLSWEGDTLWRYKYSSGSVQQHHDIEPLSNGNILLLAWEKISESDAITAGRDTMLLTPNGLWPDHIIEVKPIGLDSGEIVWTWHTMDHVIQDFDSTKANFGVIANHPELINLNLTSRFGIVNDFVHSNSIDYIEKFDQILISSRHLNEIYIIDHSTSTFESVGHSGGFYNKGGDILYRWGSDINYAGKDATEQKFFGQHHAQWIPGKEGQQDRILVFNNGVGREVQFSSVDIIVPSVDGDGNYIIGDDNVYGPALTSTLYMGAPPESFYSSTMAGAQLLPNGNILICNSMSGKFFEIDENGETVWEYINPAGLSRITQGTTPFLNSAFRVTRYETDYSAFEGKDVSPKGLLEIEPFEQECTIFENPVIVSTHFIDELKGVYSAPNLFSSFIEIVNDSHKDLHVSIYNVNGLLVASEIITQSNELLNLSNLEAGIYFMRIFDIRGRSQLIKKIIKQ